jgi:hypothetical protein
VRVAFQAFLCTSASAVGGTGTANVVLFLYEVPKQLPEIELLLRAAWRTSIYQTVRIMMRSGTGPPSSPFQNKPPSPGGYAMSLLCDVDNVSLAQITGYPVVFWSSLPVTVITTSYDVTSKCTSTSFISNQKTTCPIAPLWLHLRRPSSGQ